VYKISIKYCWFEDGTRIVKMYFINEVPFTFDDLPEGHLWDDDLCRSADANRPYSPEDMYKSFGYLISEEVHPFYFPVELENPEDMPDDIEYYYEEDLRN
tara:strand:+ start:242 stop:541 length:300 start_codon:yes stop_codon:yes gene_type:complete